MESDGEGEDVPRHEQDAAEAALVETDKLMGAGPGAGNRAGGLAFLALAVVVIAALHFHFSESGANSYAARLDTELLTHAQMNLNALEHGERLAVVPSWPIRLYDRLRRDIVVYAGMAAAAAYLWGLAARARGRRDAYLVQQKMAGELAEARRRLERLEKITGIDRNGTKGT